MSTVLSCVTSGPGWFADVLEAEVQWETELLAPMPRAQVDEAETLAALDEDQAEEARAHVKELMPVFVGDGPIKGTVVVKPSHRGSIWLGGVVLTLECVLVRYRVSESATVMRLTERIGEAVTVDGPTRFAFSIPFAATSVPETFEGDSVGIRCMATLVLQRPWWTFDVVRSLPFATQDIRPDLGLAWREAEEGQRKRIASQVADRAKRAADRRTRRSKRGVGAAASRSRAADAEDPSPAPADEEAEEAEVEGEDAEFGGRRAGAAAAADSDGGSEDGSDGESQVLGLTEAQAADVPWWVVVNDTGCSCVLDFESCVVEAGSTVSGRVVFQGVTTPVVRVRLRVLRLEGVGTEANETVLFDGDALNALTNRGMLAADRVATHRMQLLRGEPSTLPPPDELDEAEAAEADTAEAEAESAQAAANLPPAGSDEALALEAARSLPGAGTLWQPERAVVTDSVVDVALDLSLLDMLPTMVAEADDPEAEDVAESGDKLVDHNDDDDDDAKPEAVEGATSPNPARRGDSLPRPRPTLDFSVRTVLQLWVYGTTTTTAAAGESSGGSAAPPASAAGAAEPEEAPPLTVGWNSRELLVFRQAVLAGTEGAGEGEEGPGQAYEPDTGTDDEAGDLEVASAAGGAARGGAAVAAGVLHGPAPNEAAASGAGGVTADNGGHFAAAAGIGMDDPTLSASAASLTTGSATDTDVDSVTVSLEARPSTRDSPSAAGAGSFGGLSRQPGNRASLEHPLRRAGHPVV